MKYIQPHDPLLVIIGPSGSGKSRLVRMLEEQNLVRLTPSYTTRPARNDTNIDHVYIDESKFRALNQQGFFIETVSMFGQPYHYGLPKIEWYDARVPVVVLRAQLLGLVDKHYSNAIIYHIESSFDISQQRMAQRGQTQEDINTRMNYHALECEQGRKFAHRVIINDGSIDEAYATLSGYILEDFAR